MTDAYLMLVADLLASEHLEDQEDYRLTVILALGKWGQGWEMDGTGSGLCLVVPGVLNLLKI